MNGGHWGELIRADIDPEGNIWVFHRCFNTEPAGYATCVARTEPPILEFDPSGKLLKSFGSEMFAFPHGFTIDRQGNIWASDANASETVLGKSAKDANGVVRGHQVFKLSPTGKVLLTLGKEGVAGNGPDTFDQPSGIAVAPPAASHSDKQLSRILILLRLCTNDAEQCLLALPLRVEKTDDAL